MIPGQNVHEKYLVIEIFISVRLYLTGKKGLSHQRKIANLSSEYSMCLCECPYTVLCA